MSLISALAPMVYLADLCSGAIKIETPNGGESFPANSTQVITWQCDASVRWVAVEFSYTGGGLWEILAAAVECDEGRGSYVWRVPVLSSPRCLIRVAATYKGGGSDQSDATFTIFPCTLRMDYDGDCAVTFADFWAFAQEWLRCGDPYDPACTGNSPPRIISSPPTQVPVGQGFTYIIRASDPDGDELTYGLLQAPPGMAIDAVSGRIIWTPTAGQEARTVVVQVRDGLGAADVQAFEPVSSQVNERLTGAPVGGFPSLPERRLLVYLNAVRMAPQQYRDMYMAGFDPDPGRILATQGAVEPLYYEPALNASARSHAEDMAENGCFQHDSCDGTSWSDRIWGFYPQARMIGENVAAGYSTPKAVVDAWLCDETGGQCAADGSAAAGHRSNILNSSFKLTGAGYAQDVSGNWRHLWVHDSVSNEPASRPPLVAGCHDFLVAGKTSFLLNYRDTSGRLPTSVEVVIGGVSHDMSLDLGSAAAGTYRFDTVRTSSCRQYYFLATTGSGETWCYPGPGVFLTDGESACGIDYR